MNERLDSAQPSWLKIGGIGCGIIVLLAVVAAVATVSLTYRGYQRALDVRLEVDRRYGAPDTYRLPAGGAMGPDRMRRFVAIRESLLPQCAVVTETTGAFKRVDAAARESRPDVGALFGRVWQAARRMPSLGRTFGSYVTARNQALLQHGMGLGEYTWIYVTGYFGLLGQAPARVLDGENRRKIFEDRVFPEIAKIVQRHIEDAHLTSGPWVEELARLRQDHARIPFTDGLPPDLAASFEPYRQALAAAACPAAAELDVTVTVRRGLIGYDHQ